MLFAIVWFTGAVSADPETLPRLGPNEGEVLEINREAREIALRHGNLPELGMGPMSMIFKVADPALLNRVRKGDRVRFKAGLVEGRFAVMSIERVRARSLDKSRNGPHK